MKYLPYIFPKKRGAPRKRHLFSYSLLFYLNWNWLRPEGLSFSSRRPSFILWASVLEMDFFSLDHRITDQSLAVQIFSMHIHCADLMVFVGINNRFPLSHYSRKYTMWSHTFHQQLHSIPAADPLNREYGKTGWHFPTKFRPALPSPFSLIAS